jgi:hypothetical protein
MAQLQNREDSLSRLSTMRATRTGKLLTVCREAPASRPFFFEMCNVSGTGAVKNAARRDTWWRLYKA